ncbi:hypothetical protein DICVIV_04099 [Dictyocaulus viviparus]|uniref:Uncharacterized protein n=1 Tax=Dictyocaulus viviparus TaxID=29172 RepID=A0A0D8Y148_DICVI|nr:hypothetical protein DICVIV_04099 [Dictyocaulus viviparus]
MNNFLSSDYGYGAIRKAQNKSFHFIFHDIGKGIDAGSIIGPIMSPFMNMYEMMQQKLKARTYAERIAREREESPLSSSKSIFDIIDRLKQPTTTTTPQPPLIERLLRPYIEPWQKQMDDFSKSFGAATVLPTSTTPPQMKSTRPGNLLEKYLKVLLPTSEKHRQEISTSNSKNLNADFMAQLFFPRNKRTATASRNKRQTIFSEPDPLYSIKGIEASNIEFSNPFTPNSFMSLFTTPLPFPKFPSLERRKSTDTNITELTLPEPHFKLQDPFYNPIFPNKKSKLFDILAGGEAVRTLG